MRITQALLGEHAAMYPLLNLIESTAPEAGLESLKIQASFLQSAIMSHAAIEDKLLRPAILPHLPQRAAAPDGGVPPTDHQIIESGIMSVLGANDTMQARTLLLDTVAKTRKHFRKEETIIFGIAERELSDARQRELGAQWAELRNVQPS